MNETWNKIIKTLSKKRWCANFQSSLSVFPTGTCRSYLRPCIFRPQCLQLINTKSYLEVVRMGFTRLKPWWYFPLWWSSSSIPKWQFMEASNGRPSARAAVSNASWHSLSFMDQMDSKEKQNKTKLNMQQVGLQSRYFCLWTFHIQTVLGDQELLSSLSGTTEKKSV